MRILLVDDEKMVLHGLRRALFTTGWRLYIAENGFEALKILGEHEVDLIISDMKMPEMDGAELLEKVSKKYPRVIRIILSGYADTDITIKGAFFAHQSFMKPCDPAEIKREILRISKVFKCFPDTVIQDSISKIISFPVQSSLFFKVKKLLDEPNVSMHEVAVTISQEPAMCAKIVHISNSAIFRGRKEITGINEAIIRLGSQVVINLVAMLEVYSIPSDELRPNLERLQSYSLKVALLASRISSEDKKDGSFLTGILCKIGEYVRMAICSELMKVYVHESEKNEEIAHIERHLFCTESEQLGGYLLHIWGFPLAIIESVLMCNRPSELIKSPFGYSAAVYVARKLVAGDSVDEHFIEHFQLSDKLELWKCYV